MRLNPPLRPTSAPALQGPAVRPAAARTPAEREAAAPGPDRRRVIRQPAAERRRKTSPALALALCLGGVGVVFLDVCSLRSLPDADFYLSFVFGVILMVQGLRLLLRVRWRR